MNIFKNLTLFALLGLFLTAKPVGLNKLIAAQSANVQDDTDEDDDLRYNDAINNNNNNQALQTTDQSNATQSNNDTQVTTTSNITNNIIAGQKRKKPENQSNDVAEPPRKKQKIESNDSEEVEQPLCCICFDEVLQEQKACSNEKCKGILCSSCLDNTHLSVVLGLLANQCAYCRQENCYQPLTLNQAQDKFNNLEEEERNTLRESMTTQLLNLGYRWAWQPSHNNSGQFVRILQRPLDEARGPIIQEVDSNNDSADNNDEEDFDIDNNNNGPIIEEAD